MVTAIEGIVEKGAIRLRDPIALAENTRVFIIVPDASSIPSTQIHSPRLANQQQAAEFQKQVVELPPHAKL